MRRVDRECGSIIKKASPKLENNDGKQIFATLVRSEWSVPHLSKKSFFQTDGSASYLCLRKKNLCKSIYHERWERRPRNEYSEEELCRRPSRKWSLNKVLYSRIKRLLLDLHSAQVRKARHALFQRFIYSAALSKCAASSLENSMIRTKGLRL